MDWTCLEACPEDTVPISVVHNGLNSKIFNYCREKIYFVDPSSDLSNIELGTIEYPFKQLDDPIREIFNHASHLNEEFTIYLKHGPYKDQDQIITEDESDYTLINVILNGYQRKPSNFNPTIPDNRIIVNKYDFKRASEMGLMSNIIENSENDKFVTENADLTIEGFKFVEYDFIDWQFNSLIRIFLSPNRVSTINNCYLVLQRQAFSTAYGTNLVLSNSFVDITNLYRLIDHQTKQDFSPFLSENGQNFVLVTNNTFYGINSGVALIDFIYISSHFNISITGNIYRNFQWGLADSIYYLEHEAINDNMEKPIYYTITNNLIENTKDIGMTYIGYTMKFKEQGYQVVRIYNNTYRNLNFGIGCVFQIIKKGMENVEVYIDNLTFENVIYKEIEYQVIQVEANHVQLSNIQVTDSKMSCSLKVSSSNINITNILYNNVQSLQTENSMTALIWIWSSNLIRLENLKFQDVTLVLASLIQSTESQNIEINGIDITRLQIKDTNLIKFNICQNVKITNANIDKIFVEPDQSKISSLVILEQLKPYEGQEQPMYYIFYNWNIKNITTNFMDFKSIYSKEDNQNDKITVLFQDIHISEISLTQPKSYVINVEEFQSKNLSIEFNYCSFRNNLLVDGRYFNLKMKLNLFRISNLVFQNNTGRFIQMIPNSAFDESITQSLLITDSNISNNFGKANALIYKGKNTNLTIKNSIFVENFSNG
ncbi:UNKNOWN [Stylonychia lemnae]|uniref:Right handed beta helix domain-containing protein n=1 Tax=Stylonychia lemnae TaxID=5949 RepID=A0A078A1N0_STYLE|nr:UNKNOWN [Stylonychia lemnae]|eukprot:CDW75363.1 UNKNOWN [Stylonychia lemnae]